MKKEVILALLLILTPVLSADITDDFSNQIKRLAYYGENFESNNIDYSQLIINLNSVKENINAILQVSGDGKLTSDDLKKILGEPKNTNWVESEDGSTQVQLNSPVHSWPQKTILDGNKIQLKMEVVPSQFKNEILYSADFSIVFKEKVNEELVKQNIENVKRLSREYALDPSNLQKANELSRESVNTQKIFDTYFAQSTKTCHEFLSNIFGEEKLSDKKQIVVEEYKVYEGNGYSINAVLSICENCKKERWIGLDMVLLNGDDKIKFFLEDEPELSQFSTLNDNGIKRELIEANGLLERLMASENYKSAYLTTKKMEILTEQWNKIANIGDNSKVTRAFIDRSQFFAGFFQGYKLISSSFYDQEEFFENFYLEVNGSQEICYNQIDDDANNKIDCQENICTGQVCGTKKITVNEGNQTVEREIELYCIEGECKEKEIQAGLSSGSICGNGVCEENEQSQCPKDCSSCPTFSSKECNGHLISKGTDANGCQLEPICIKDTSTSCITNSNCIQPLCGKSECIEGFCTLTSLNECSQPKCTDGEKKSQLCSSGESITIEICSNGLWITTGAVCQSSPVGGPKQQAEIAPSGNSCSSVSDCKSGSICSNGQCKELSVNSKSSVIQSSGTQKGFTGQTFTGKVVTLTGEPITGTGITSALGPDPLADDFLGEADPSTLPKRNYQNSKASSFLTGLVREGKDVELIDIQSSTQSVILTSTPENSLAEFSANAVCKTNKHETNSQLIFKAQGEKFATVSTLLEKYQEKGPWCELKLTEELKKRKAIEQSFNVEFAKWFYDGIYSDADNWETKKVGLIKIYNEITENEKELAYAMDCLSLKQLNDFNLINFEYSTSYGSVKVNEEFKEIQLPDMARSVTIPYTSMETSLFLSKDYVGKQLERNMEALAFPSKSTERKLNGGLTKVEKIALKENAELKSKIAQVSKDLKDGYLDSQVTFITHDKEGNEKIIYNLYARINEENIFIQPMPTSQVPNGLDEKVVLDYDKVYDLMFTSEENEKDSLTLHPSWDNYKFRPVEKVAVFKNWIVTQSRIRSTFSSVDITPNKDGLDEVFRDIFFLIANN